MHRCNRPASSSPKDNSRSSSVAHDRRRGTSLVPFSPEMTTAAARAASGTWYTRMRAAFATRASRKHFAFPVVALHHFFSSRFLYCSQKTNEKKRGRTLRQGVESNRHVPSWESTFTPHFFSLPLTFSLLQNTVPSESFFLIPVRDPNESMRRGMVVFFYFSYIWNFFSP